MKLIPIIRNAEFRSDDLFGLLQVSHSLKLTSIFDSCAAAGCANRKPLQRLMALASASGCLGGTERSKQLLKDRARASLTLGYFECWVLSKKRRFMGGPRAILPVQHPTYLLEWHRWFAWYPVPIMIDGKLRYTWLQSIERKWGNSRYGGTSKWRYRIRSRSRIDRAHA